MRLHTEDDILLNQLGGVLQYTPVKGLVGSWLTPDLY